MRNATYPPTKMAGIRTEDDAVTDGEGSSSLMGCVSMFFRCFGGPCRIWWFFTYGFSHTVFKSNKLFFSLS